LGTSDFNRTPLLMARFFSLAVLFVSLTGILSAAEPYRMCLRNTAGQISLPDETGVGLAKKTYFIDLNMLIQSASAQSFGGSGKRFKALEYDAGRKVLKCEEVETGKRFELEMGKWINFMELPP
jgi:hypothetical protein